MVRVCPVSQSDAAESSSFLKVDPRKKQITIMDPSTNQTLTNSSQKKVAANQVPPKMFTFDAAFPPDASQVKGKRTYYPFHDLILKDKQVILVITNKYKKGGLPHLYEGISNQPLSCSFKLEITEYHISISKIFKCKLKTEWCSVAWAPGSMHLGALSKQISVFG